MTQPSMAEMRVREAAAAMAKCRAELMAPANVSDVGVATLRRQQLEALDLAEAAFAKATARRPVGLRI